MDFSNLLTSLADSDLVKRKPNAPPSIRPTPSQEAVQDITSAASDTVSTPMTPVGTEIQTRPLLSLPENPVTQGIADQPSNVPVENAMLGEGGMPAPPLTLENRTAIARQRVADAHSAPVEKQSKWKDAGAYIIQGLDSFLNGTRAPIKGYGAIKKDRAIREAEAELAPLERMQKTVLDEQRQVAGTEKIYEDQRIKDEELQRKIDADKFKREHMIGILSDKKKGRELQATQIEDLKKYREWLMQNGDVRSKAYVKQIDERLKDYDEDRASRERIAGAAETGRNNRAGVTAGNAQVRTKVQAQAVENSLRKQMTDAGASPEEIEVKIKEYRGSLGNLQ